jgi:hypothetical protein
VSLLSLLRWTTHTGDLADLLNRFTFVDQVEIIKFLQEIFDAMFAILDANKVAPDLVYNSIVFIIGILMDEKTSRFTNFRYDLYRQLYVIFLLFPFACIKLLIQIAGLCWMFIFRSI